MTVAVGLAPVGTLSSLVLSWLGRAWMALFGALSGRISARLTGTLIGPRSRAGVCVAQWT